MPVIFAAVRKFALSLDNIEEGPSGFIVATDRDTS
jgi:hypothetical protein